MRHGIDGAIRMTSRWRVTLVVAVAAATVLAIGVGAVAVDRFDDVEPGHPHEDGIGWVADAGVTIGCEDGSVYCPRDGVSRDQMATFLHRLSGNAPGVAPSVDAATVQGLGPEELRGERGPAGPEGPQGEPGADGLLGLEYVFEEVVVTDSFVTAFAACPAGKAPLGGGGMVDTPGWFLGISTVSYDEETDALGWFILAEQAGGAIDEVSAAAVATCAYPGVEEDPDFEPASAEGHDEVRSLEERYARARADGR
jgi:hypothetical protein